VRTLTKAGEAKLSTRATEQLVEKGINLGLILQTLSLKYPGAIGGGHAIAAGATVQSSDVEQFLVEVEKSINQVLR
jgi:RecJ-like exonuclease